MITNNVTIRPVDNSDYKGARRKDLENIWYQNAGGKGMSWEWETFDHFVKDAEQIKQHTQYTPNYLMRDGRPEWVGFYGTGDELMRVIEHGWPELRQKLEGMLAGVELETPAVAGRSVMRRRKRVRADHGDTLDINRVWNGDLERAWEVPRRTEHLTITTKRVTLAIDICSSAYVESAQALWRAALGMKLADSLVRAGRVLEIWGLWSVANPYQYEIMNYWYGWMIKSTKDPLVLDRLCSMLSLSMLRVPGFMAQHADTDKQITAGRGYPLNYGLTATLKERQDAGELVLRIGECYSMEALAKEYNRAWKEVIDHSDTVLYGNAPTT